jgi:hypothetical protein
MIKCSNEVMGVVHRRSVIGRSGGNRIANLPIRHSVIRDSAASVPTRHLIRHSNFVIRIYPYA